VAFLGAVGDLAIPFGFGLSYVLGLYEEDAVICELDVCRVEDFEETRVGHAGSLAISLAAPVLAHFSGQGASYTLGDARALRSFGLLGAQVALALAWAPFSDGTNDPDKRLIASVLAGSAAGLWAGNRSLRSRSLSGGDGLLVMAGHLAGGLGALGVTYLLDGGPEADDLVYLSTSAAGSVAGALLMLHAVSSRGSTGGPAAAARVGGAGGLTLEVNPSGALLPLVARSAERVVRAPLVTLRF